MPRKAILSAAAMLMIALGPVLPASAAETAWDGLVEVNSPRMDAAFLMPGADFRPYTKVMLDTPEVAFRKNWMRDMNSGMTGRRVTEADARKILEGVQGKTSDIFQKAFLDAGYQVVTEPGEDVLRVRSGVVDLYVNAPDTMSAGFSRTYVANAGEATLVLEVRDSLTNALMARVLDRRETRRSPGRSTSFSNEADYRALAAQWASLSVKGLKALAAHSPIPDPLASGQKLD